MIKAIKINHQNESVWNEFFMTASYTSYISSMPYMRTKTLLDKEIETYVFERNSEIVAGVHYVLSKFKSNVFIIADIQTGFIFKNYPDHYAVSFIIDHFLKWAKLNNACYARIYSWFPLKQDGVFSNFASWLGNLFTSKQFRSIEPGKYTYWIDLTLTEEQLLKKMKSQTRRKLKKAINSSISFTIHSTLSKDLLEQFWNLYSQLGNKKGFKILHKDQFFNEVKALVENNMANIIEAKCQGVVINIAAVCTIGNATYYHGALNPEYKNIPDCPSPGHITQWEIMKFLKSNNHKIYDMAYCPGPVPIKNHPDFNMWNFKYSFGGVPIEFFPRYGKILKPVKGKLFQLIKHKIF